MSSRHTYYLRYQLSKGPWREHFLPEGDTILGRDADCQIILDDPGISRHHLKISRSGDSVWITDLGSTNKTYVDGQPLPPYQLFPLHLEQFFNIESFSFVISSSTSIDRPHLKPGGAGKTSGFWLHYRIGEGSWQAFPIPEGDIILGRSTECDLILEDDMVSRQHARLTQYQNQFWITDLGSTNGTQVDGSPLSPRRKVVIGQGQTINIGNFFLHITTKKETIPYKAEAIPAAIFTPLEDGTPSLELGAGSMPGTMIAPSDLKLPPNVKSLNLTVQDRISIGRSPDNNLILNHPLVSRYHAIIERLGTRFRLHDLRSTNGVYINGKKVAGEIWLKENDEIRIGAYIISLSGNNLQAQVESGLHLEALHLNQQVSSQINLLKDITIYIKPMEFIALVGMSGSGKSTLLNALSGYRPASHGEVLINENNLYLNYDLFRHDIGYVPQKDIVHAELTPQSALEYVARLRMPPDTTTRERQANVAEVLQNLDLTERKDVPISRLSGGQLKRVSIGVELLTKPRLFFLDEPTSGLDPGTEYDMMKLLRRLADQGRTVMLVTHATKNVMLCDKVIFLARGGHLAYFGPPEEALEYFNNYRTQRERREKEMEFDDIYRILNDEKRGAPADWDKRYHTSQAYNLYTERQSIHGATPRQQSFPSSVPISKPTPSGAKKREQNPGRISGFRQFVILSERNLKILIQDKVSLGLMLALAPVLGVMDFIWGSHLYDPVDGDAGKIITMWFMTALITVLVGALSSVREIVKEIDIYKRERAVNLKVMPYILSKVWVGIVLAIYQAGVLLFFRFLLVRPEIPVLSGYLWLYITLFLATLCGYLIGLAISASAPNQNAAMLLIIVVLVPQFLFAGALLPLDLIPGGEYISWAMPTRWTFESFIRVSQMGDKMTEDPCWLLTKAERLQLTESDKEICPCMGENIFVHCTDFPGILSPDFYDESAKVALTIPKPIEPPIPTAYPYPTALPSPTPLPTPTLLPSPTPYPTPSDPRKMGEYMDQRQSQGQEYQNSILDQFTGYRLDSQVQGQGYSEMRTEQGDEYSTLRQAQGDEYSAAMRVYGDDRAQWQETREKAISSAEALLATVYDNYGQTLKGSIFARWVNMLLIMLVLLSMIFFFQKRKDVI